MQNFLKFQGFTFLILLIFDICFILIFSEFFGVIFCGIILGFLNFGFVFKFCIALWQFHKGTYKEEKIGIKFAIKEFVLYFIKALLFGILLLVEAFGAFLSSLG